MKEGLRLAAYSTGRLSAEDLAQLKENLLRVAKQEEQQARSNWLLRCGQLEMGMPHPRRSLQCRPQQERSGDKL
eukprot:3880886-Amphidinium_carterae.2